jgi:hypothetical protein
MLLFPCDDLYGLHDTVRAVDVLSLELESALGRGDWVLFVMGFGLGIGGLKKALL